MYRQIHYPDGSVGFVKTESTTNQITESNNSFQHPNSTAITSPSNGQYVYMSSHARYMSPQTSYEHQQSRFVEVSNPNQTHWPPVRREQCG